MVKSEEKTPKSEKASSPAQEQTNTHLFPDWAAIQAYYGPGVPLPSPYFNSAVMAGHVPHPYMWASPQPLMPPYGVPYTTIYSHGGVYAHPAVPFVTTPLSTEMPSKSSDNVDQGLTKKLKRLDRLSVPVGNDSAEIDAGGAIHEASQSVERGIDGSSDGSDGHSGAYQTQRKSGSEGTLSTDNDVKVHTQASPIPEGEANATSSRVSGTNVVPANVAGKSVGSPNGRAETSAACVASTAGAGLPFEAWKQDERQLKREKRKRANRESARKSRLRKQAENEELTMRYESLNVENMALKSEINLLTEESEKLRLENAALEEKLKNEQLGRSGEMAPDQIEVESAVPNSTESFSVNNADSDSRNVQREYETQGNSNSETKLHQLLESSSRADAVVAG